MLNNVRIIHKHAVEAVWETKVNFVPYQGEFIVFDTDTTHDYARVKIGDGKTPLKSLPFLKVESATTAEKLSKERIIRLDGFVQGEAVFDGSKNITLVTSLTSPLEATFIGATVGHTHQFSGAESTASATYIPEGSVAYEFQPSGRVSTPQVTLQETSATLRVITGKKIANSYTPATYVSPKLTATHAGNCLIFDYTEGSYTPAVYIEGELDSADLTYLQGVTATASEPEFEGNLIQGTATLIGQLATITMNFVPEGDIQETSLAAQGTIVINTIKE